VDFGEDCADKRSTDWSSGKMPTTLERRLISFVDSFQWIGGGDLPPVGLGEGGVGGDVGFGFGEHLGGSWPTILGTASVTS